ncbi:MAG: protease modulator HflC [Betaproteobacteria bacterium]|nr:protease modulator HflC [Betaproteobacteria bacterium]
MKRFWEALGALVVVSIILGASFFTLNPGQDALVLEMGRIVRTVTAPGLYVEVPLLQRVRYFDTRLQTLEVAQQPFTTADGKALLIDYFVKWRVVDPRAYYLTLGGEDDRARARLAQGVNSVLRGVVGKQTLAGMISGERTALLDPVRAQVGQEAARLGLAVMDVRFKGLGFPPEVSAAVYRRMAGQRERVAATLRAQGKVEATRIQADADKRSEVILAKAYQQAQTIEGQGDARAAAIYARAYGKNPRFYAFYRSLQAYRQSFSHKSDVLVLRPDSEFFRYFQHPGR